MSFIENFPDPRLRGDGTEYEQGNPKNYIVFHIIFIGYFKILLKLCLIKKHYKKNFI